MYIAISEIAERLSKSLKVFANLDTEAVKDLFTSIASIGEISKRMHQGTLALFH